MELKLFNCFVMFNCVLFLFLVTVSATSQIPTYTVVAPSKLRPNSHYHVNLQLQNASAPVAFEVVLSGKSSTNGSDYSVQKSVSVNSTEPTELDLEVGQWTDGKYKLTVTGKSDELKFKEEKNVRFESKSFSIFVQTDKAMYKPGQKVQFRVIVVNPDLLPNVKGSLDIYLKDSKENLIKQWKGVSLNQGVFAGELQLSELPPLGDWSIKIELQGQKYTKTFTVAEYVLPTFSVDVLLPPYATYNRSDIVATVKATYTYGKPVKGDVILTFQPKNTYYMQPQKKFETKTKLGDDGSVDIPVNIVRDLNMHSDSNYEQEIEFSAEVEETLTGRKYNKSSVIKIYEKEFKLELIKLSKTFKPGLKYTAFLKVAYQDDKPVEDNGPAVSLKHGYTYHEDDWAKVMDLQPSKGLARVDIFPPKANMPIGWKAEYRGHTYHLESVEAAQSPSNSFIQLVSKSDQDNLETLFGAKAAVVGQQVAYQINSTEPLKGITYKIIAKGDIVHSRTIRSANPNGTTMDFAITVTPQMTPKARLVVYYVREDNREVVADTTSFKVDGAFKTPVNLSSNVAETKPGGQVDLQVQTNPSAYVGLLGVDQSVLLLKSGNDITRDDVLQELESYDTGKQSHSGDPGWSPFWRCRPIYSSDASTAAEIFDDSGLIILTNGVVYRKEYPVYRKTMRKSYAAPMMAFGAAPEMAMMQRGGGSMRSQEPKAEPVRLRQKFPETWIWSNISAGSDGVAKYSDKIPDTITSWFISAFALDETTGLGVVEDSLKVKVFRPFFIQLSLPYSIIRGESVALKVLVFNYQKKSIQADVVMENLKDEFEFTNAPNEIESAGNTKEARKTVTIAPFDGVTINFVITPKKLGNIDIKVRAAAENAGDAIVKKLLVKPEGQTQYFNKAQFIKLDQGAENIKRNFTIDVPPNVVPGSLKVKVSGISDILGPTLNNIDDLLRMPYGCGEQNMINLVPNIVVLNYLTKANRLTGAIKTKAVNHIEQGYQRELTYRRHDGSFSAFGNSDKEGSTWLTAFVVRSFIQARPFIDVDQAVISQAVMFLLSHQQEDGSFVERGEVHHKDLQGGAGESSNETAGALTAYVLIAVLYDFKSAKVPSKESETAVKKAENFIFNRLSNSKKPYEVAMITYALHLADSSHKEAAYAKLISLSKRDGSGLMYWSGKPEAQAEPKSTDTDAKQKIIAPISDYLQLPKSLDVESSAYGLLTMVTRSDTDDSIPILRWLISKQNSNGGFSSTQDTVIGLQALGAIAGELSATNLAMAVAVTHGNATSKAEQTESLKFSPENALVLQQIELKPDTEWVELDASGSGTAVVQVSYQYNIAQAAEKPAFALEVVQDKTAMGNNLKLDICTFYTDGDSTNMAVMEVELPSGYLADLDSLRNSARPEIVKRVDTTNNDGTVVIYFDRITKEKQCVTVPAYRAHRVANNKPVPVTIYDYYDRSKLSRVFYEPAQVSLNDIAVNDSPNAASA